MLTYTQYRELDNSVLLLHIFINVPFIILWSPVVVVVEGGVLICLIMIVTYEKSWLKVGTMKYVES